MWTLNSGFGPMKQGNDPLLLSLQDLSAFNDPSQSWKIVGAVSSDLNKANLIFPSEGNGILLNQPSKKKAGKDLLTKDEFGSIDLELDYMIARKGNSGIYIQGRYEVQLADSWDLTNPTAASNGGVYGVQSPRVNASKAPGLWQKLKISFQAPKFDSNGKKIENARLLQVVLNGVLIQENVELLKPTDGALSNQEVAKAPLRLQGDHGAVAFRNIKITNRKDEVTRKGQGGGTDPILVEAQVNTVLRSFINLDNGVKIVHAASVGSPLNVHYSYDLDHGMLAQVWRGEFLDATPMWNSRGNGVSVPRGAVQRFGKPAISIAKLADANATWPVDTANTQFRQKGYQVDQKDIPTFKYFIYGKAVSDMSLAMEDGRGLIRTVKIEGDKGNDQLYFRLAKASKIEEMSKGKYVVGDQEYYIQLNSKGAKPVIRTAGDEKELIVPINGELQYSILF